MNHIGPVLPRCSYLTWLELTAALPRLRARRPPSPANITHRGGKPCESAWAGARAVSVNALNTQGDSDAAHSGSAWSKGRRWVISRCDWSGSVRCQLESWLALFAGRPASPPPETQPYSDLHAPGTALTVLQNVSHQVVFLWFNVVPA